MKIKMSFIIIVLNGMPYIKAALESIYKAAHEIVIVEGAETKGEFAANSDGSSNDGTVECIKSFPDPHHKIKLLQGKWFDKCNMQNTALKKVTGNYIWLVDSDEIYKEHDVKKVIKILSLNPGIYQMNLPILHFWKDYNNIIESKEEPRLEAARIFRIDRPCYFTTHRPPTLMIGRLRKLSKDLRAVRRVFFEKRGIYIYHYSWTLLNQVIQKTELYRRYGWEKPWKMDLQDWFDNCFMKWTPENRKEIEKKYRIIPCDRNSKTKLFKGTHPDSMKNIIGKVR